MRTAIADTNERLDLAVSPGVILLPSSMIILEKAVVGFNNILTIGDTATMSFGKNSDVNRLPKTDPKTDVTPCASVGSMVLLPVTALIARYLV